MSRITLWYLSRSCRFVLEDSWGIPKLHYTCMHVVTNISLGYESSNISQLMMLYLMTLQLVCVRIHLILAFWFLMLEHVWETLFEQFHKVVKAHL